MPAEFGASRDVVPPTKTAPQPISAKKLPWYKRLFDCCTADTTVDSVADTPPVSKQQTTASERVKARNNRNKKKSISSLAPIDPPTDEQPEGEKCSSPLIVKKLEAFYETKRNSSIPCQYEWASARTPLVSPEKQNDAQVEVVEVEEEQSNQNCRTATPEETNGSVSRGCRLRRRADSTPSPSTSPSNTVVTTTAVLLPPPSSPPQKMGIENKETDDDNMIVGHEHVASFNIVQSFATSDSDAESHNQRQYDIAQVPWQGEDRLYGQDLPHRPQDSQLSTKM